MNFYVNFCITSLYNLGRAENYNIRWYFEERSLRRLKKCPFDIIHISKYSDCHLISMHASFFSFSKCLKRASEYSSEGKEKGREVSVGSFQNADVMAGLCGGNWRLLGNILPSQSSPTTPHPRTEFSCWRGCRMKKEGKPEIWHGDLAEFRTRRDTHIHYIYNFVTLILCHFQ